MPSESARLRKAWNQPDAASQGTSHDWSSLTISVFTGRPYRRPSGKKGKLRHGPKAFALLDVALMTLFTSFCKNFNVVFVVNLLSITEAVSKSPAYSHITFTCHRLNENTSGPDLLPRALCEAEEPHSAWRG